MGIVLILVNIYTWGLIFYVLLSWIRTPKTMEIREKVGVMYEPLLSPISNMLAPFQKNIGIDFSPIVLILILNMFEGALKNMF